jgi:hypothetical protein
VFVKCIIAGKPPETTVQLMRQAVEAMERLSNQIDNLETAAAKK